MLGVIPNGTGVVAGTSGTIPPIRATLLLVIFNVKQMLLGLSPVRQEQGTQLPLVLRTNNVDRVSIGTDGNVDILGTGARIRGDFSNATVANRVAFQSSVVNGNTMLVALPNGTAKISGAVFHNGTDPKNAQRVSMSVSDTSVVFASTYPGLRGCAANSPEHSRR